MKNKTSDLWLSWKLHVRVLQMMRRSEFTPADVLKMDSLYAQSLVHFNKVRLSSSPHTPLFPSPLASPTSQTK